MKQIALIFLLALLMAPDPASAVSAPANVTATAYQQNAAAQLYWDEDTTVSQWFILFNGRLTYQPLRQDTGLTGTARRSYLMTNIAPERLPLVITMKAMAPGQPLSAESAAVTLTANAPIGGGTLVYNDADHPLYVSGAPGAGVSSSITASVPLTITGATLLAVQSLLTYPSNLSSVTLQATTSWTYVSLTCSAQPCSFRFWTHSNSDTLEWRQTKSTSPPTAQGASMTPGALPVEIPIAVGDVFNYKWLLGTGTGTGDNRWP